MMNYRTGGAVVLTVVLLATCGGGGNVPPPHWPDCPVANGPTNANASVFLPSELGLRNGDAFAVFTDDVGCIGQAVVQFGSRANSITIWGDDPQTPAKDGAVAGDSLRLRVHLDRQTTYGLAADTSGNWRTEPTYQTDALYTIAWFDGGGGATAAIDSMQTIIDVLAADNAALIAANATLTADLNTANAVANQLSNDLAVLQADYVDLSDRVDQSVELLTQ